MERPAPPAVPKAVDFSGDSLAEQLAKIRGKKIDLGAKPSGRRRTKAQKAKSLATAEALAERVSKRAPKPKRAPMSLAAQGKTRAPTKQAGTPSVFNKLTGRTGPTSPAKEPPLVRDLKTNERAMVVARAEQLLKKRKGSHGDYPMTDAFVKAYGDTPGARALNDAIHEFHRQAGTITRKSREQLAASGKRMRK